MKLKNINSNKIKNIFFGIFSLWFAPNIIFAQTKPKDFSGLTSNILIVIGGLVNVAMAFAVMYFLVGVVKYLTQQGNEKARSEAIQTISWGLLGLFVMITVWGLVKLIQQSLVGGGSLGIPQFGGN